MINVSAARILFELVNKNWSILNDDDLAAIGDIFFNAAERECKDLEIQTK